MGKKPRKPKKPNQVWKLYDSKSGLKRRSQFCPKCGPGYFLAAHKNRSSCGKCGYSEMAKKQ